MLPLKKKKKSKTHHKININSETDKSARKGKGGRYRAPKIDKI